MLNRRFLQWVLANGKVAVGAKNARGFGGNENSAFYLFLDLLETQRNPSLSDPLPDLLEIQHPCIGEAVRKSMGSVGGPSRRTGHSQKC